MGTVTPIRRGVLTITETTNHGSFYCRRTVELPSFSTADVAEMMRGYSYVHGPAIVSVAGMLATFGHADHGWTHWEVER